MNTQPLTQSTLLARASAEVEARVQDELNIPDPEPDKAIAALIDDKDTDEDTEDNTEDDTEKEDENGKN